MHVVHEAFVIEGRRFKRGDRIEGEDERKAIEHPFFRQFVSRVAVPKPQKIESPRREAKAEE